MLNTHNQGKILVQYQMRRNPWGLSSTYLSQELPLNTSNASKNGTSEKKSNRTVQNIPNSVKDVNNCIFKYEISEGLKFKNAFRWL